MELVEAGGARLEVDRIGAITTRPTLVFLHEGLGSVALWKGFPRRVAERAGLSALVYSRRGHGASEPRSAPHAPDFMHVEGERVLPELLDRLGVARPILIGHSDGASIAILYAATERSRAESLVLMAPHVFVEDLSIASIERARERFATSDLRERLAPYHADAEHTFRGWNDVWLSPAFRAFDIQREVARVRAPMLVIQGRDDEYGTAAQYESIGLHAAARTDVLVLDECGHSPHRDREQTTLYAIAGFVEEMLAR